MKEKFKIIFVDIDWTILDHNIRDWDYESINELKRIQKKGVLVYLCTARPFASVLHTGLFDIFKPDGVVCTNGGVAFVGEDLLFANIIPEEYVRQIEKICNKHHLVIELCTNKDRYFSTKPNGYVEKYFLVYREVVPIVKKYHNKNVSSILLFAPEKYDEVLKKEFPSEMNLFRFDTYGVDVGLFRNTKGGGIKRVLEHLNIETKYAIGVGDSFDDISMFENVGLSIAMGNGTDEAKAAADVVSDTIGNHGLAIELKKLF